MMRKRMLVGLSGGVDSSVTALLLKQQGFEVAGMFMKNWEEQDVNGVCPAEIDADSARAVAAQLGIPFHARNFATEYWDGVFSYFLEELKRGRTPNPDVLCNREVKFKTFVEHASALGFENIATGHYARRDTENGVHRLRKALDDNKDQSYFLHQLDQSQLANTYFPLGEIRKPEVRALAAQAGLSTFDRKDSTGICFIGERAFTPFLRQYLAPKPGPMRDIVGKNLGEHQGLQFYTLGQRGGLGIGGQKEGNGQPWFVIGKDLANNILIVHQGEHPALFSQRLRASSAHWVAADAPFNSEGYWDGFAKTRYRQPDQACRVWDRGDGKLEVAFQSPQRAVTPGQFVVFYQGDVCLGGATIDASDALFGGWERRDEHSDSGT